MKVGIFDPREEWPQEFDHLLKPQVVKKGGILMHFSAHPEKEESFSLRAFSRDSIEIVSNPSPGINIEVIVDAVSPDNSRCYKLVFHIYSTDGEDAPIEWFKTAASLLESFGLYFIVSILPRLDEARRF